METIIRNQKIKAILSEITAWLLALMFTYTAVSKVYDWHGTKLSLYNQVLPDGIKDFLLYALPMVEILAAVALLIPQFRKAGFIVSLVLMSLFTGYVILIWIGLAGRVPCSCGGIISSLSWGEHLVLNLVFLGISIVGWRSI
jgi:uncharacterized membrane protein YphA (DoxX/SURF4 family)